MQCTYAVIEEVDKLLEARAIEEDHDPDWLFITVVVEINNGKWSVWTSSASIRLVQRIIFSLPMTRPVGGHNGQICADELGCMMDVPSLVDIPPLFQMVALVFSTWKKLTCH